MHDPSRKLNEVLITIDALRPDHLSCYGYERRTSKNIDIYAGSKGLLGGEYFSTIRAKSTNQIDEEIAIPIQINVKRCANILANIESLVFENASVGFEYSDSILIKNNGDETLVINNLQNSNADFNIHFSG